MLCSKGTDKCDLLTIYWRRFIYQETLWVFTFAISKLHTFKYKCFVGLNNFGEKTTIKLPE
jgi:hypothetical protein